MPTLVARIVLAGTEGEVSPSRRMVVDKVRAWGVPLDDEMADTVRLVASELITNAVVHGDGPVTIALYYRPGSLVIDVVDGNPSTPIASYAAAEDESGRGLTLVDFLAVRSGWEPVERGKRVWAEIAFPKPARAVRAAVLRRFFTGRSSPARAVPESLPLAVA